MLSPDNFVQNPGYAQNFNRYSYAYNNPLKYTDPTGDYALVDDAILGLIGGTINVISNAGSIHSFGQGAAFFGVGFAGGVLSEYITPVGSSALVGAGNAALTGYYKDGRVDAGAVIKGAIISGATSLATMGMGNALSPLLEKSFSGIASPVLRSALIQGVSGTIIGGTAGGIGAGLSGGDIGAGIASGALWGGGIGFASGVYSGFAYAKKRGLDPWTGDDLNPISRLSPIETTGLQINSENPNFRTKPTNLREELAMQQALLGDGDLIMVGKINDPNYQEIG
jgi:hypothetical protein